MVKTSAGILLYRIRNKKPEVFLVHPGGPFFAKKDSGAWGIPKGEFTEEENPLVAAKREFEEETGFKAEGNFIELAPVKLKSGKIVFAWALEGDADASLLKSNTFHLEWPPRSGKMLEIPEVDRGEWFSIDVAKQKISQGQAPLIDELMQRLKKLPEL